ncbi:hypothetical protein N9A94_00465 [Akkermansiaceae bacterium]|nr:hypothetical protein [Akkermansiaceae bacterium]
MKSFYFRISPILGVLCTPFSANAADKITYDDHIFPIFESKCLNCHNPDKKKGDLDLSTYTGTMAGSSGGKIALAGDGGSSKLYTVTVHTEEPVMPPEGDKIAKKDSDMIRAWIDGGLLENKGSTAKKRQRPAFSLAAVSTGNNRPEGPPPMPKDLLLEPVVVAPRATVVNDMDASPWAPLLAVTGQYQILLYNTDTLSLVGVLPFPKGQPETVSFHPGGKYLLAGGGIGGKSGSTTVWDITNGDIIMEAGKEFDSVLSADLRADLGAVALGGPSRLIKLWDTQAGEQLKSIKKHTEWITALAYSLDGILLATGDRNNGVQVWEAASGNEFHSLRGHQKGIVDVKWRADSNLLATASEDGQIIFWDMNEGKEIKKVSAHGGGVLAMDYALNGDIVTSGRDKRVKLWKPDLSLKKELPGFPEMITEVEFSHDAKRVFVSDWNGDIQAWDTATYQQIGKLEANPPTIASRLVSLNNEKEKHIGTLKTETDNTTAAQKALEAAKADLANKTAAITSAKNSLETLIKESDGFAVKWKEFELAQQNKNNEHKGAVSQLQELQNQTRQLTEQHQKITAEHQQVRNEQKKAQQNLQAARLASEQARNELAQAPDNPELKEKVAKAEKSEHEMRQQEQQFPAKLANLEKRIAESNQAIKEKEALAKGKSDEVNRIQEERNKLVAQRDEAGKMKDQRINAHADLKGRIPAMENAIKPATDNMTATDKLWKDAQAKLAAEQAKQAHLNQQIAFWKSAEINTKLLEAKAKTNKLKSELREAEEAQKQLANQYQESQKAHQ